MAMVGIYNSAYIAGMGGEDRETSSPHFLLDRSRTYTPSTPQSLVRAGFFVPPTPLYPDGSLEIGVFRVSNEALISSVIVEADGAGEWYEALAGTLQAGIEYCRGFRIVSNVSIFNETPGDTGGRNASRTGANALANPFGVTADDLSSDWAIFFETEDAPANDLDGDAQAAASATGALYTPNLGIELVGIYKPNDDTLVADATGVKWAVFDKAPDNTEVRRTGGSSGVISGGNMTLDSQLLGVLGGTAFVHISWMVGDDEYTYSGTETIIDIDA